MEYKRVSYTPPVLYTGHGPKMGQVKKPGYWTVKIGDEHSVRGEAVGTFAGRWEAQDVAEKLPQPWDPTYLYVTARDRLPSDEDPVPAGMTDED